jgi:hypothetical protein
MNSSLYKRNLDALEKLDPSLYKKIVPLITSTAFEVYESKSGLPTLSHKDALGNKKQIHSNYDPKTEAIRYLKSINANDFMNFIFLGFGLGYQAIELIRNSSSLDKFFIFEKDLELLALALKEIDLTVVLDHPGVKIIVGADPLSIASMLDAEQVNFTLNSYTVVRQNSLFEKDLNYYGSLLNEIEKFFQECQINFRTQSTHSKLYYKNIFSNLNSFISAPGIKQLKSCLTDIPAIVCSAGPSLDKNIQLLKSARKKFFLIAVATALKPLLHNGIEPDVVVSIDPDELTINSFDLNNDTPGYWLVFNPAVPKPIPESFPFRKFVFDSDVFLATWLKNNGEDKGSLGKISSVAHSAVQLAQYLGCSTTILVGQDLSFCKQRQHCLNSFYHEEHMDKVSRPRPLSYWDDMKFRNFGPHLVKDIDLFGTSTSTTIAMQSYNNIFQQKFNDSDNAINATEGGIPIQGIKDVSLREALYNFKDAINIPNNPFNIPSLPERDSVKTLEDSLLQQIQLLQEISKKLNALKSIQLKFEPLEPEDKQIFINQMKILYENILKNKDTALLLQGYDFAGFSDWYRANTQILRKKELTNNPNLMDEEFERDIKIFEVLVESVDYLKVNFEKFISSLN